MDFSWDKTTIFYFPRTVDHLTMAFDERAASFDKKAIKDILQEIIDAIDNGESTSKLNDAKATAGNDMMKLMQYVFPVIVQIEMDIIKKYGFIDGREGMIQFTKLLVDYEKEDKDIALLHKLIRSHFLPPVTVASDSNTSEHNPCESASREAIPTADLWEEMEHFKVPKDK